MNNNVYLLPNPVTPSQAVFIDEDKCIGCNRCVDICRTQTIMPNPEKGGVPVVIYQDECWFCACCVDICPTGALKMRHPLNQRSWWKDKETGQLFRLGMVNPPPQTYTKPASGRMSMEDNKQR